MTLPDSPRDSAFYLNRLKAAAAAAGLELLDKDWHGAHEQYRLCCTAGHIWSRNAQTILYRGPLDCPECQAIPRFARLVAAVEQTGSICLDTSWRGIAVKYRFRCMNGHLWERSADKVFNQNRTVCPHCMQKAIAVKSLQADGLARLRAMAVAKGGECLSDHYLGMNARYRFRCREGHEWEAYGCNTVLHGKWCRRCANEDMRREFLDPAGLVRLQAAAAAKGGVCLSETYIGVNARHQFRCAQGHEWKALASNILKGSWCLRCVHDARRLDIALFHAVAAARGGQCLSEIYHNSETKLTWMCHKGHVWQALPGSVRRKGNWCPVCANADRITRTDSSARMRYGKAPN